MLMDEPAFFRKPTPTCVSSTLFDIHAVKWHHFFKGQNSN